jgi:phospholipid/cholesterol/gamma-HCH transport system permease protein
MSVDIRAERNGDRVRLVPAGSFDLAHAATVAQAVERVQPQLVGCRSADVDLADLGRFDGAGAVLLARFLDRLDSEGCRPRVLEAGQPEAARLIALYRERRARVGGPPRRPGCRGG